jgi:hypothetical protein
MNRFNTVLRITPPLLFSLANFGEKEQDISLVRPSEESDDAPSCMVVAASRHLVFGIKPNEDRCTIKRTCCHDHMVRNKLYECCSSFDNT